MANKDDERPEGQGAGPDGTQGPEEQSSGPVSQDGVSQDGTSQDGSNAQADELTLDDILGAPQNADAAAQEAVLADLESALLGDLKRLQAEYANYRRRTEEQREREIERAKGEAAKGLLPVLDDLDRAAKHGDLQEGTPFSAIGEKIRTVAERLGVTSFGSAGEAFDPQVHEAIFQQPIAGTEVPTVLEVVEVGYRLGSVELRPAKVVVAVPAE
ncbi:Protein GrpE [Microbacterium sp. C448]|uniref:nucleotide exchange factor GrpE n=1 Tax=Microbacterium TaxID=33882 RepID=UPI0003DE0168|nr:MULTISPECIES: nucleotide exchange factor GrpE [Microbacterium]MDO8383524.1 nucleotide exchange factor GrpE [Microbacterium sp.]CDK00074.1 Protein GrpE [Microbacterium sp. C448]